MENSEKETSNSNFDYKDFLKQLYKRATEKEITSRAAQVAFYFIFALFPLLLFIISLFGLVLRSGNNFQADLFNYLGAVMPSSAFDLVSKTIKDVVDNSSGGTLTVGFVIALWSASAGIDSIIDTLNNVYNIEETRSWWKRKLTSALLTLSVALLVFFALAFVIYGSKLLSLSLTAIGFPVLPQLILTVLSYLMVGLALLLVLTLIYSFGPNHPKFKWHWINAGSIAAIVLWILFSIGFQIYLHFFNSYAATYGSVGAIIILLFWLYLTALVILIGGTINALFYEDEVKKNAANDSAEDVQA